MTSNYSESGVKPHNCRVSVYKFMANFLFVVVELDRDAGWGVWCILSWIVMCGGRMSLVWCMV